MLMNGLSAEIVDLHNFCSDIEMCVINAFSEHNTKYGQRNNTHSPTKMYNTITKI